jgi:hypothetical protein
MTDGVGVAVHSGIKKVAFPLGDMKKLLYLRLPVSDRRVCQQAQSFGSHN